MFIYKPKAKGIGECKLCGSPGYKSNQGGIDGVASWEVSVAHKKTCPAKNKGQLQGEVTWHDLSDWNNFYSR